MDLDDVSSDGEIAHERDRSCLSDLEEVSGESELDEGSSAVLPVTDNTDAVCGDFSAPEMCCASPKGKALKKRKSVVPQGGAVDSEVAGPSGLSKSGLAVLNDRLSEQRNAACLTERVDAAVQVLTVLPGKFSASNKPVGVVRPWRDGKPIEPEGTPQEQRTGEGERDIPEQRRETFAEFSLRRMREVDDMARLTPPPFFAAPAGSFERNEQRGRGRRGRGRSFGRGRGQVRGRGHDRGRGYDRGRGSGRGRGYNSVLLSGETATSGDVAGPSGAAVGVAAASSPAIAVSTPPPLITLDSSPSSPSGSGSSTDDLDAVNADPEYIYPSYDEVVEEARVRAAERSRVATRSAALRRGDLLRAAVMRHSSTRSRGRLLNDSSSDDGQ